jgi:hypothetical protein
MFDSTLSASAIEQRAVAPSSQCLDAVETAEWLLHWYPHRARASALAMHELAAWQYDDSRTEHWRLVLDALASSA